MTSVLRILKVNTKEYKKGTVVELFITEENSDNDTKLHITIKGFEQESKLESIEIIKSNFDSYFKQEPGLDKVYNEYHKIVGNDLLNYNTMSSKKLIRLATIVLMISLILVCFATALGGTVGIVILSISAIFVVTFLCAIYRKSKKYRSLDDKNITVCRDTRKCELTHMLTNLGYLNKNNI